MTHDPEAQAMTFWEHLDELRSRILRSGAAFIVGMGVAWLFHKRLLLWLTHPFIEAWNRAHLKGEAALHFPAPAALFLAYLKITVLGGFLIALPFILYQLWAFISPGLYKREKRYALPFVVASCALFASGGYFGWRFAFPVAFQYLLGFSGPIGAKGFEVTPVVMIGDYIAFVTQLLLAFGTVFELPILVFFLSVAGIINHRHLLRFGRYFIVIAFIVAAVLTPPDITSQFMLAVPLCTLYIVSIGVAYIFGKRPAKN